jgi:UDP-glucose 4-epimerase
VLRLFNTYGPGQGLSPYVGAVTIFCNRLADGESPLIYGDGKQCRDFVHVADVVQALVLAGTSEITGETINVGTGVATNVNQVVTSLQDALGMHTPPRHSDAVPGELRCSVADISKARRLLGYSPAHAFSTAVREAAREIVNQRKARIAKAG